MRSGKGNALRRKIDSGVAALSEGAKSPGVQGFGKAMALASMRAWQTLEESVHDHPILGTAMTGALGARLGGSLGNQVHHSIQAVERNLKNLG